ncbi:hypothetical protein A1O1_08076 [Capronia coronata CBS 617.96]|uniref:Uncharacterized protein n=1 Tax=Capronia coronata CBS 617.96 TaxID=1182541 RepID=W9XP73_9EURO|nr:uncharacterized protein A1O1_08076 [Capronia coronata CBS 617.96]EXJ82008.1 hypothetical protein A1O1_08076 [Capronia coronata CBS 617.96]
MDPSTASTPWGDLGRLSGELREKIYQECVRQRSAPALTRASRAIHHELDHYQYEDYVLIFDLNVGPEMPAVSVHGSSSSGGSDSTHITSIDLRSHHARDLDETPAIPFERFKAIHINVHCPDAGDPGQLIQGYQQVTRFLDWLLPQWAERGAVPRGPHDIFPARCNTSLNLPHVHLRFAGSGWTCTGPGDRKGFQHSIHGPRADHLLSRNRDNIYALSFQEGDLMVLMMPFRRIRHARSLAVELPREVGALGLAAAGPALQGLMEQLPRLARSHTDFGLNWDSDSFIMSDENKWHTWLNFRLEALSAKTAAQLRRTQLYYWCDYYATAVIPMYRTGIHDLQRNAVFGTQRNFTRRQIKDINWMITLHSRYVFDSDPTVALADLEHEPVQMSFDQFFPDGIPAAMTLERLVWMLEAINAMPENPPPRTHNILSCPGCRRYREHQQERRETLVGNVDLENSS